MIIKLVAIGLGLIVLISIIGASFTTVGPGQVGVKKRFGAVDKTPLKEGLHFLFPGIDRMIQMEYENLAKMIPQILLISTEICPYLSTHESRL